MKHSCSNSVRPRFAIVCLSLLALAASVLPVHAESAYFIGNSVTDTINYSGLEAMAVARGKTQPWGRQMIPGAPLEWLWTHPADGFTQNPYGFPTNALPNYAWDILSLQPFDRSLTSDLDYIQRYLDLLYGAASPTASQTTNRLNTRLLIFGRWPRQDDAGRTGGPRDYDTLWLRTYTTGDFNSNESADFANDLTLAVRAVTVNGVAMADRTFMVPVGHVMYALNQQMKAGQITGYTNIFQIYADGIHLTNVGAYLTACTFYAVIYRDSPVGLPVPSNYGTIDSTLVTQIQETVWNVVQVETLSGVPSAGNLLLTTPAVPPGYQDQSYSTTLMAVGGILPRTFAVTEGALPPGLTLASSGLLSGIPTTAGDYTFTVTVSDATTPVSLTASRSYNLRIDTDTVPTIITGATLPGVNRGGRYDKTLVVTGGNGTLTWTLTSGALPPGLLLGAGGVIYGSALTVGNYTFTLQVADADIPADTASRTFTLEVGEPSAETLLVARTLSPIRIDGSLAETHWNLAQSAARTLLGTPDNTTQFAVLWDADNLYIAARVTDAQLSNGAGSLAERDAIEIFLDAYNDKQAEFNVQHRQFRVALDGLLFERGGRSSGVKQALNLIPGGYEIEMSVPWTNLAITPTADQTVIGLDLANDDADTAAARQHYQVFGWSDPVDPRPSQFGNVILTSSTVTGTGGEPIGAAGPSPVAHEPFDYAIGPLHGVGSAPSFGFSGTWQVEQAISPGYAITGNESLTYGQLGVTGRYMTGGNSWQTCGRSLPVTTAFLPWKRSSDNFIGKDGTTLWISYLAKPLKSNVSMKFSLDDSISVVHDNNKRLNIKQVSGFWHLSLMNGAVAAPTSVAVTANTTYFLVTKIEFNSTDTVSLYVNPALGATPPATPSATASTAEANFRFDEFQLYPGTAAGDGNFDEIRFGATWESVVPIPALPVSPVTFSPLPGAFASPPTVTLATTTSGATIYYTTDGSTPTTSSTPYTAPVVLTGAATLKAIAVMSGSVDSPVSGGLYTLASPLATWTAGFNWGGADSSPGADPNRDGVTNLLAYALDLHPLAILSKSQLPQPTLDTTTPGGPWLNFTYRENQSATDLSYSIRSSTDMVTWTDLTIDNVNAFEEIADANPDGDGSSTLVRIRVKIPGATQQFLRLRVVKP